MLYLSYEILNKEILLQKGKNLMAMAFEDQPPFFGKCTRHKHMLRGRLFSLLQYTYLTSEATHNNIIQCCWHVSLTGKEATKLIDDLIQTTLLRMPIRPLLAVAVNRPQA